MNTPDAPDSKGKESGGGAYLSPKLREKLMEAESSGGDWQPKKQSPLPMIIALVVLVGAGGGLFFMMRSKAEAAKKAAVQAEAARVAAAAESVLAVARADSLRVIAVAESTANAAKSAVEDKAAKEVAAGPYGVRAGSYIDEDRAKSESTRLGSATGLPARVVPDGSGSFYVVLGSFTTRAAAEGRGMQLLGKNLIGEALVVTLPKKK